MKLIIAGGRDFNDAILLEKEVRLLISNGLIPRDFELVCGMAKGADLTAYNVCKKKGTVVHKFPANWDMYGRSAGHRRNREMGDYSDALLAFWDGKSPGTKGMIEYMRKLQKPTYVVGY